MKPSGNAKLWLRTAVCMAAYMLAAAAVAVATARGVGMTPDSMQYLTASQSIVSGAGLNTTSWEGETVPLRHFPPGYPLVVATALRVGAGAQPFIRWSNILLLVLTITAGLFLARRVVADSPWAVPGTACALAMSHDLIVAHTMAWSEPLYITITLAGVLLLGRAIREHSVAWLASAAIVGGMSSTIRYVGLANVMLCGLAPIVWWPLRRSRVAAAAGGGLIAAIPMVIVVAFSQRGTEGALGNRRLGWHPPGWDDLSLGASAVSKWLTPLSDATFVSAVWLVAIFAAMAVLLASARRALGDQPMAPAISASIEARVLMLYGVCYMAVLVLAMTLADAQTSFEPRILVPVQLVFIVMTSTAVLNPWRVRTSQARVAAASFLVLWLGANVARLMAFTHEAYEHGLALGRVPVAVSPIVQAVRDLPPAALVYSNDPYFLRLHSSRSILGIPRLRDPNSLLLNPSYDSQVREICRQAVRQPTYVVMFESPQSGDSTARAEIALAAGESARFRAGAVVRVRPGCETQTSHHAAR